MHEFESMVLPDKTSCCSKFYQGLFKHHKRYDDFTFWHGKVFKNTEDKNFYYRVERKHDKLPSKVMSDFADYFNQYLKEIHPYNQYKQKLEHDEELREDDSLAPKRE